MHTATATESPVTQRPLDGDTFEALDHCHQQVLETLQQLSRLIDRLQDHGVDAQAQALARNVVRFFSQVAQQHHSDEERLVFPGLLASGNATLVQHVRRLQQDHGWLEEDWLTLQPPLSAIAEGYSWYDLDMLRHALPVFVDLYLDHIELEESLIYPEAKARLQPRAAQGEGRTQRAARAG